MTVQELIDKLASQAPDAVVIFSNTDGCYECNPYDDENHYEACNVEYYPGKKTKNGWLVIDRVVIS